MTYAERAIIRRGHPSGIILRVVGAVWGLYFLWIHNWIWTVATIFICELGGLLLSPRMDEEGLSRTTLGKITLLHLHPVNLLMQLAGGGFLIYGVWTHSMIYIMVAASMILLGHLWGWNKVNPAL